MKKGNREPIIKAVSIERTHIYAAPFFHSAGFIVEYPKGLFTPESFAAQEALFALADRAIADIFWIDYIHDVAEHMEDRVMARAILVNYNKYDKAMEALNKLSWITEGLTEESAPVKRMLRWLKKVQSEDVVPELTSLFDSSNQNEPDEGIAFGF